VQVAVDEGRRHEPPLGVDHARCVEIERRPDPREPRVLHRYVEKPTVEQPGVANDQIDHLIGP
jgi:hypothetical protein